MQTQDRVGQQFGNYRLIDLLGKGGYAEVYLAQNVLLNNLRYAIKILTGTNLKAKQREEFLAEAQTVAGLQRLSSHIVQIHDFGVQPAEDTESAGIFYLVMEYAPDGTLRTLYPHETRVPFEHIVLYVNQVAEALQCAHDQKPPIIHCDVKPENMLLRSQDHLLLSDFGIATTGRTNVQTISTGPIVGTATYMAPERLSVRQTGRASDQYSLGVVVYEWLCGFPPFEGLDLEVCYKHMTVPPPGLSEEFFDITPEIEAVVMRALRKKPADRYPTVTAFANALEEAIQNAIRQGRYTPQSSRNRPNSQPRPSGSQRQKALPSGSIEPTLPRQWPIVLPSAQTGEASPEAVTMQPASSQSPAPILPPLVERGPSLLPERSLPSFPPEAIAPPSQPKSLPLREVRSFASPPVPVRGEGTRAVARPFIEEERRLPVPRRPVELVRRRRASEFFDIAPQFLQDQRHGLFIYSSIFFDAVSAILPGRLWSSFLFLGVGLIFSLGTFVLSVVVVESVLATFFAVLNAAYWLAIGWSVGSFVVILLHLNPWVPPAFTGIVFFGVSLGLNIRYIARKKF